MEYHQAIQQRAAQTAAVVTEHLPALTVGGVNAAALLAQSTALDALAQTRDHALANSDAVNNLENQGYLLIARLDLALPQAAEGDLDDDLDAESALLDLLSPAYAITPSTTPAAIERGQKVVSALTKINAYLAALPTPRLAITSGGLGLPALSAALAAQPALMQLVEDRAADVSSARTTLRTSARAVDRLNKRFYSRLQSEARANPALDAALGQIETGSGDQPATLGLRSLLQGGADNRHLLLSYDNASYLGTAKNTVEWMVEGVDADFTHSAPVDPSGNALGPFAVGQKVKLRTRVTTATGTTTGSPRTLTLLAS